MRPLPCLERFFSICSCLSGSSGRHGGVPGSGTREGTTLVVMGWKGEEVMTSGCFMGDWSWFVFSRACCWHLHTLELLAGRAGRNRGVAGCKLAHWHGDRLSGHGNGTHLDLFASAPGLDGRDSLSGRYVWKYQLKEHTTLGILMTVSLNILRYKEWPGDASLLVIKLYLNIFDIKWHLKLQHVKEISMINHSVNLM